MVAIRMMFSWLTEKGILAINPARAVKTPKFSRTEGKAVAFSTEEVQKVLASIDTPASKTSPRAALKPAGLLL